MQQPPRIPLAEATAEQLTAFLAIFLGVDVAAGEKLPALRAKVTASGWQQDTIPDMRAAMAPAPATPAYDPSGIPPGSISALYHDDGTPVLEAPNNEIDGEKPVHKRMVHIRMQASNEAGGSDPVFVGVNGIGMLIPRNEAVWVPEKYVESLLNAVTYVYDQNPDPFVGGLLPPRAVPAYPFSYV